jgi:hypothetical protein
MSEPRTITLDLPEDFEIDAKDLEVMRRTFMSIVTLANRCGDGASRPCDMLIDAGWDVDWSLVWVARAHRGKDFEEATGATRREAMHGLYEAVRLHESQGCP